MCIDVKYFKMYFRWVNSQCKKQGLQKNLLYKKIKSGGSDLNEKVCQFYLTINKVEIIRPEKQCEEIKCALQKMIERYQ
jgi:hypothetical protein